jgi:hypothetical protein
MGVVNANSALPIGVVLCGHRTIDVVLDDLQTIVVVFDGV